MGGGVSIDRCVDEFNATIVNRETDENCKQKEKQLSNEEKIELKKYLIYLTIGVCQNMMKH
mgnify:CR=1 FL=1